MAQHESDDRGRLLRTMRPLADERPSQEMNVVGWLVFVGLLVLLLPLGVVLAALRLLVGLLGRQVSVPTRANSVPSPASLTRS